MQLVVRRTEDLGAHLRRVWLGGPGLDDYVHNQFTDAYVKLVFPRPGVSYPVPLDLPAIRLDLPSERWPVLRTYTVRRYDGDAGELAIDFVLHGDAGVAGPWAARATSGDELVVLGPGGAYAPRADADWHLFVADESAIPAVAAALERLPASARALAFVEVESADDELVLDTRAALDLRWVHRDDAAPNARLVDAVRAAEWPVGRPHAFVHGELGAIRGLRPHLLEERGLTTDDLSISGYWRVGKDEDGFQAEKAEDARRAVATS